MNQKNYLLPLFILTSLFFMWGFATCLNDTLSPFLKSFFELSHFQANLVQFAFFGAYFIGSVIYFILSITVGDPMMKIGYKSGLFLGLIIAAIGCLGFYPAAQLESFGLFLGSLFTIALGFTLLQIAANPYVTLLGSPEGASGRLNLSQAFNSFGTTIAPLLGGYLIYGLQKGTRESVEAIQLPYVGLAGLFVLLGVIILATPLPSVTSSELVDKSAGAFKHRNLVFGMIAIFFYVGAEVSIGNNLASLAMDKDILGITKEAANSYVAWYWGGAMIGRFLGAFFFSDRKMSLKIALSIGVSACLYLLILYLSNFEFKATVPYLIGMGLQLLLFVLSKGIPSRSIFIFSLASIGLLATTFFLHGSLALWFIIAVGLFNSIMWSNIFALSLVGLGKYTSQASSLLVMMILGGALIPPLQGIIADSQGIHFSFVVPMIAYVYLAFFGLSGYKPNKSIS